MVVAAYAAPGLLAPDSSRVFSFQRSLPTADIPEHPDRGKRINRLIVAPFRAPFLKGFNFVLDDGFRWAIGPTRGAGA